MKTIQPVIVWYNGQEVEATILSAFVQNDNLQNSATFQYQLLKLTTAGPNPTYTYPETLVTNSIIMTGEAYTNWDTNDYAYEWIAQQLNLTITGEYIPWVPPSPTPEPATENIVTEEPIV